MLPSNHAATVFRYWLDTQKNQPYQDVSFGYLLTSPNQTIIRINNTLLDWLGYEEKDVVNEKTFQDFLTTDGKMYYTIYQSALEDLHGFTRELSYTLCTKEAQHLDVIINSKQMKNESNEVLFTELFIFNFPERKKYEEELLNAKRIAEEIAATKTLFLSNISHEIRTPIHAILGASDLLLSSKLTPEQMELLNTLRFSSENLLQLINDVLDFSRLEHGKLSLHLVNFDLHRSLIYLMKGFAPKVDAERVDFQLHIDEDVPKYVIGDKVKIIQILNNLISNAIKFTHKGSIIVDVSLAAQKEKNYEICFKIIDTGIGIDKKQQQSIFEGFHQANHTISSVYGGTGLGLSISKSLVELHQGHLTLNSEVGEGSTFAFVLPLQEGSIMIDEAIAPLPLKKLDVSGLQVLLVEDNINNLFIASSYFKKWKIEYNHAPNGQIAVEMVQHHDYDLVLMDMKMPIMDGLIASATIRELPNEKFKKLPIVALSAAIDPQLEQQLSALDIQHYILKPFNPNRLKSLLATFKQNKSGNYDEYLVSVNLDLNDLSNVFDQNSTDIAHYLTLLLKDWRKLKIDLIESIEKQDANTYRNILHQMLTALNLLKITDLQELLSKGKTQLLFPDTLDRRLYFDRTIRQFEATIEVLEHHLAQLKKEEIE